MISQVSSERRMAALLGLGLWVLYVWTAAPGLSWYDAGELCSAAHSLGIAHPSGFPLWILLAKGAALVPVGTISLRITLLGAGSLVAAALLGGWLAARMLPSSARSASALASCTAVLGLGLSAASWRHATAAEVYGLQAVVLALLLAGLWRLIEHPSPRLLALLSLLAALGLGNHGELRFFGLVLVPVAALGLRARMPGRALPWVAAAGLVGLSLHLYLPLRAASEPAHLWEDVSSWSGFWDHLRGARIFAAYANQMGRLSGPWASFHLGLLSRRLLRDLGFLPLLAVPTLVAALLRQLKAQQPAGPLLALLPRHPPHIAETTIPQGATDIRAPAALRRSDCLSASPLVSLMSEFSAYHCCGKRRDGAPRSL